MQNMFCKIVIFFLACFSTVSTQAESSLPLQDIHLPPHFKITLYAENVKNARSMTLGDHGIVFVGSRKAGKVYALLPDVNFSKAKQVITLASDLKSPNGVTYYNDTLYVAEIHRILKFPNIEKNLSNPKYDVIYDQLPTKSDHGWRYMAIGPDHWLYLGIGAPCNACEEKLPFATISRIQLDGKNFQIYATGIRNTVGFDWDPVTKYLWFTENGRDWLGENIPPDELNIASHAGMNFGFPYFWGNGHRDTHFSNDKISEKDVTSPALELPAHVAALGMRFYTGKMFPKEYFHQVFIAEHGSWNRFNKVGYQIVLITVKHHQPISQSVFASGWMKNEDYWGRPVDVLVMPDGSLLVSDDYANAVYRITYKE